MHLNLLCKWSGHIQALSPSLAKSCWLQESLHLRAGLCGQSFRADSVSWGYLAIPGPCSRGTWGRLPLQIQQLLKMRMEGLGWEPGTLPGQEFQEKAYSRQHSWGCWG